MVKLRLTRMGSKNNPFYRIVAIDSRKQRDGEYIESVGYDNPVPEVADIKVDTEKALKWLNVGAQPSETVRSIFKKAGILELRHDAKKKEIAAAKQS